MVTQTLIEFPHYGEAVRDLVEQHRLLTDEPLVCALYYKPARKGDEENDVFLFEVADRFGNNRIDPARELFEITFDSSSGFPLGEEQQLHLVLTNPVEVRVALEQDWPVMAEINQAVRDGDYSVVWCHPDWKWLVDALSARGST